MGDNVDLMYNYTEKEVESFDKGIDTITNKLMSVLAFSGVSMKLVGDLHNSQVKIVVTLFVAIAIVSALVGLIPQDRGWTLRSRAFVGNDAGWWYNAPTEEFQLRIIRQWIEHIKLLEKLLDRRAFWFKISLTSLSVAALLFAFLN